MKKAIFILSFFIGIQALNANEVITNRITLAKHYKTESTFSGNLSKENSFHLIFTKNKKTKNFEVFSYLFDGQNILSLAPILSEKSYGVVSFHQKDAVLSLILSYKKKRKTYIKRIDYNLTTKVKSESEAIPHNDFLTSIRQKEQSILIYKDKETFSVLSFTGNQPAVQKDIRFQKKSDKLS